MTNLNENKDELDIDLEQLILHLPGYVYYKDLNSRYLGCNVNTAELAGLNHPREIVGKTDDDLWGPLFGNDFAAAFIAEDQEVIRQQKTITGEYKLPLQHKDGQYIYIHNEKKPLYNRNNELVGVLAITTDITDQKLNEQLRLKNFETENLSHYLNNLISQMPNNVYWLDRDCILRGGNDNLAKSLNLSSRDELSGLTYEKMAELANIPLEQMESMRHTDLQVMKTGTPSINKEEAPIMVHGKTYYYLSSKIPLKDKAGAVIGVVGISIDITELKQTQEALRIALDQSELANRSKSEFIQNMSHDIRNPLAGILGMAQILYGNIVDENKEYAHMLVQASERLLDLLNNVLDLASAAQENHLKQEPVELKDIAEGLKELLTPSLHPKQLQFNLEIDQQIPTVLGDANKIERILLNLLNNAIKFTEQGNITLKIETLNRKQDRIQFAMHIIDTGIGIPEDKLHRVFEEFFRVHPSYEGIYKGHGVGLYIVKKYTELMHGDVTVQSQLGVGTTFTITLELPIVAEKRLAPIPVDVETQPIHAHILLIEDEELALRAAKSILEKAGHTVTIARNLKEAHQQIKTHPFEVIVTDLGLPDGSGMDLARAYRKQEQSGHTPIFALTGHGAEVKEQCFASGIDAVFTKGKTVELLKNIQTSLSNSSDASGGDAKVIDSGHLFNLSQATELLGDEIDSMIHLWLTETLPEERAALKDAHQHKDWDKVQHHAHKLKGSSAYVGTQKLYQACKALEDSLIFGGQDREVLFQTLITCIDETQRVIEAWVKSQ
jgi:two-component system, OmpR family, aerobic respiration control sensor histidine kinase ArcB